MFFYFFELGVIVAALWFISNVLYFLIKKNDGDGGGYFGMAKRWLNSERKKNEEQ